MKKLCFYALILFHLQAIANPSVWIPLGGGNWDNDSNWTPAIYPDAEGAAAVFPNNPFTGDVSIDLGAQPTITIASLDINLTQATATSFSIINQELVFENFGNPETINVTNSTTPVTIASAIRGRRGINLTVNGDGGLIVTGQITGDPSINKRGSGTFTIQGTESNTPGNVNVYEGTVVLNNTAGQAIQRGFGLIDGPTAVMRIGGAERQLSGSFVLTINNGLFDMNGFNQSMGGVNFFGGRIRQNGRLLTTFGHPFIMRNTYLEGPVQIGSGDIRFDATNGGTAVIDGNVNLNGVSSTFTIERGNAPNDMLIRGRISNGGVVKRGPGVLNVAGLNTYAGGTTINEGTLNVSGTIVGTTTVNSGGTLIGTGTTGDVINNGNVNPGDADAIGTLNILGSYSQGSGGNLTIEVDDLGESDLLNVSMNAALGGTVSPQPQQGIYPIGTRFQFLNFNTMSGAISLNDTTLLDFSLQLNGSFVELINNAAGVVLPVRLRDLKGNPSAVADYLFCPGFFPDNQDFYDVLSALVRVPSDQFAEDLVKLSPFQFGALPLVNLQSHALLGNAFVENTEKYLWCDRCTDQERYNDEKNKTSVWITPLWNYYHQDEIDNDPKASWADKQIPFNAYSVGFGVGADHLFFNSLLVGGAMGYTYSHLDWEKERGRGHWNSIYWGPYVGYFIDRGFINFLAMGSYNTYHIDRNIRYPGVSRTATNNHHSFDLLLRVDGGYTFRVNAGEQYGVFFILPEATISYLNIFEEGYIESGAGSLNLRVDSQYTAYLQPSASVKFLKDIAFRTFCMTPAFQVGWIANVPLSSNNYTSRLYKQNACQSDFSVKSFHNTSNQLTLGGEVVFRTNSDWIFEIGYKADLFDNQTVQSGRVKVEKRF